MTYSDTKLFTTMTFSSGSASNPREVTAQELMGGHHLEAEILNHDVILSTIQSLAQKRAK